MKFGPALAERHNAIAATLCLLHNKEPNANQQQHGQNGGKNRRPPGRLRRLFRFDVHAFFTQRVNKRRVVGHYGGKLRTVLQLTAHRILDNSDLFNLLFLNLLEKAGICNFLLVVGTR